MSILIDATYHKPFPTSYEICKGLLKTAKPEIVKDMNNFADTLWGEIKKIVTTYGPSVLRFLVDKLVWIIIFLKNQISFAIRQLFKM